MIKLTFSDLRELKKQIPEGHLIIGTSNYKGFRNFLGFLAQFIVNPIQKITKAIYDNKSMYIAHTFIVFYKNNELWVGEMDKERCWRISPIARSNTFVKLTKGRIDFFDLGEIKDEELEKFLNHAYKQKYSLLEAISSLKLLWFLNIFISKESRFNSNKCHCGSIFIKYKPFHHYLNITGKRFFKKFGTHHPEALFFYLEKSNFKQTTIKAKKGRLCL